MSQNTHYDVLIVGAGVAGSSLAYSLSTHFRRSKPLRVAVLERSLSEPDRIVGELLQPSGVLALRKLGMESCLENIGAVPAYGYCVVDSDRSVRIPYPHGHEGRSFHHGRFIMALREKARQSPGVDMLEATVTELIECNLTRRVIGVRASGKDAPASASDGLKQSFFADLVVVADGCFSNFRTSVMGDVGVKPTTKSHFVGAILEDAKLPIDKYGTVALVRGYGPVLLYQISENSTRMLVNVKHPPPADIKVSNFCTVWPVQLTISTGSYFDQDCSQTTSSTASSCSKGSRKGPSPSHAKLIPSSCRARR
jgi:squalene monooxygenase